MIQDSTAAYSDWRPALHDGLRHQQVADGLILLDRHNAFVHQLDAVGRRIAEHCDGAHSVDEIVYALLAEFEVDEQRLREDVTKLLGRLKDLGVVD